MHLIDIKIGERRNAQGENTSINNRRVSFNTETEIRYRTASEDSASTSTLQSKKAQKACKSVQSIKSDFDGRKSVHSYANSNSQSKKFHKKTVTERKFDMLLNGKCSWSYKSLKAVENCKENNEEPDQQSVLHIQRSETSISFLEENLVNDSDEISFEESTTGKKENEICHLKTGFSDIVDVDDSNNKSLQDHQYNFDEIDQKSYKKGSRKKIKKKVINKKNENKCETPNRKPRALRSKKVVNYVDIDSDLDECWENNKKMKNVTNKSDEKEYICDQNSDNSDEELVFQTRFSDKNANVIDVTNSIESNSFEINEEDGTAVNRTTISPTILKFDRNFKTEDEPMSLDNSFAIEEENVRSIASKKSHNLQTDKNLTNESFSTSSIDKQGKEILNGNKSISKTICTENRSDDEKSSLKSDLEETSFELNTPISSKDLFGIETLQLEDVPKEIIVQDGSESNAMEKSYTFSEQIHESKVETHKNDKPKNLDLKKNLIKDSTERNNEVHQFPSKNGFSDSRRSLAFPLKQIGSSRNNKYFNKKQQKIQPLDIQELGSYDSQETSLDTTGFKDEISATEMNLKSSYKTYWDDFFHKNTVSNTSIGKLDISEILKPESEIENIKFNSKDLDFPAKESAGKEEGTGPRKKKRNREITKIFSVADKDTICKRATIPRVNLTDSCESDASNRTVHLDSEGNIQSEKTPQSTKNLKRRRSNSKYELSDGNLAIYQQESFIGNDRVAPKRKMEEKSTNKRKKANQEENIIDVSFLERNNSSTSRASQRLNATKEREKNATPLSKKPKTWEDLELNLLEEIDNDVITATADLNQINAVTKSHDILAMAEARFKGKDSIWKNESSFNNSNVTYSFTENNISHKQSPLKCDFSFEDKYKKKDKAACLALNKNSTTSSPSLNIINKAITAMSKCTDEYLSNYNGNFKDSWMKYHNKGATNAEFSLSIQSTIIHTSGKKLSMTEKTSKYLHNICEEIESTSKLNYSDDDLEDEKSLHLDSSIKFSNERLKKDASPDFSLPTSNNYSLRKRNDKLYSTLRSDAKSKNDDFEESLTKKQENVNKCKTKQLKRNGKNKTNNTKLHLKNNESSTFTRDASKKKNNKLSSNISTSTHNEQELSDDALDFDLKTAKTIDTQLSNESSKYDRNIKNKNMNKIRESTLKLKGDDSSDKSEILKTVQTNNEKRETTKDKYIQYLKNLFQNNGSVEENSLGKIQNCEQEFEGNQSAVNKLMKDDDLFSISSEDSDTDGNKCCHKEVRSQSSGLFFETLDKIE